MPHDERKRAELRSMGFTDDVMIDSALTRARGNVESAVEMLFEGVIPPNGTAAFDPGSDGPVVSPQAFGLLCGHCSQHALAPRRSPLAWRRGRRRPCPSGSVTATWRWARGSWSGRGCCCASTAGLTRGCD